MSDQYHQYAESDEEELTENEAPPHVIFKASAPRSHSQVIQSLQSNILILDTELIQLEHDLVTQRRMIKKYGPNEGHEKGEKRLLFLKNQKENARLNLIDQLEKVEAAIRGSHQLAKDLENAQIQEEIRNARRLQERQKKLGAVGVQLGLLRAKANAAYSDPSARLFEVSQQQQEGNPANTSLSHVDLALEPNSLEDRLKAASPILSHRSKKKKKS